MARIAWKLAAVLLALALLGAGPALAVKAKKTKAEPEMDIDAMLTKSFDLTEAGKMAEAEKVLQQVLKKDPGNPLALNNLAAVMVKQKKYDKAEDYLNQALPRARGYMVTINKVCAVGSICMSFKPKGTDGGNQELEPLINLNLDMIRQLRAASETPTEGGAK